MRFITRCIVVIFMLNGISSTTAYAYGGYGACCVDGECVEDWTDEYWCTEYLGGVFVLDAECSDNPCQPIGACEVTSAEGTCCRGPYTQAQCESQSGIFYEGVGCNDLATACEPGDIHVPDDFETVDEAVQWAHSGDTIVLGPGTHPANNLNLSGKSVTIRGATGNAGDLWTTIDGQNQGRVFNLDSSHVDSSAIVIKDLVITGGTDWGGGGGVYARNTSPTIMNCTFTGNSTTSEAGGAVRLWNSNAQITGCLFYGNSANNPNANSTASAAAISVSYGSPTISGCTIRNNTSEARAGGIFFHTCDGTISNCEIIDNTSNGYCGGGIGLFESSPTIVGCRILGNTNANGWGGGGICVEKNSLPTIIDCTIQNNETDTSGGGIYIRVGGDWGGSIATLSDTSVCSNTPDQIDGTWTDNGGNAIEEVCSLDSDGDGVPDTIDAFPDDASESMDSDGDGIGDNADNYYENYTHGPCCVSSGCVGMTTDDCTALGATWLGEDASCDDCAPTCQGDANADGVVDVFDLLKVIDGWGTCP